MIEYTWKGGVSMKNEENPRSLKEALSLRRARTGQPCMGGTAMEKGAGSVLNLSGCEEFTRLDTDGRLVHIGAGCTPSQLMSEPLLPGLLRHCAKRCPEELQNTASLGGAVCAGDEGVLCALTALGAQVTVASECGRRTMPLRNFRKKGKLNLASDELLCEILVPESRGEGWAYEENADGLIFAGTIRWEKRRLAQLSAAFAQGDGTILRFPEFEREMLSLTAKETAALRGEYLKAYRRWWYGGNEEKRDVLLGRLETFLLENRIG